MVLHLSHSVLALLLSAAGVFSFGEAPKFLLISSPSTSTIGYVKLPEPVSHNDRTVQKLTSTGLRYPQGIAVDSYRKRLYVADPSLNKIVYYDIKHSKQGSTLEVGDQHIIASNVESRWVAVDGVGHCYFSDERNHKILRITASGMANGETTPEVVYHNDTVSAPGGVAVDNYYVYWVNKDNGLDVGSLVRGTYWNRQTKVHSKRSSKSYGCCVGMGPIFYTSSATYLYGISRDGGEEIVVSNTLRQPRGCIHDGESIMYVADAGVNTVYALPSGKEPVEHSSLTATYLYEGAYGLAIFSR